MPRSVAPKKKSAPKTLTPAQFWKLPIKQRRIAVAEDVIKQVRSGKYDANPGSGSFFVSDFVSHNVTFSRNQLKKLESCCVCGLGACLVSAVTLGNRFKIQNDESLNKLWPFLKKIFTEKTLALIEIAFEGGDGAFRYCQGRVMGNGEIPVDNITTDEFMDAKNFRPKLIATDDGMLVSIMENIIKNKGEFVP